MKKTLALMTVLSAVAAAPAFAEDVEFNATVASTCTIDNLNPGTLAVNGDATVLASTNAGGAAGSADVTANSANFTLTVSDPTAFATGATPAGSSFVSSTVFNGNTFGAGASQAVPAGTNTAVVDLTVTSGTGSFANGAYTAIVTLTCS